MEEVQLELSLPAPPASGEQALVPARMVNEWVYCPRLAWLEWVDGQWADSGDTAQGRRVHARVDSGRPGALPVPRGGDAEDDSSAVAVPDAPGDGAEVDAAPDFTARSVTLSSQRLGLIAKMDVIEGGEEGVTVIDYKKGKRPHVAAGAYEPERVQLCAQALVLEDNGYKVADIAIWYAGSRERVRIALDDELRRRTMEAIHALRLAAASTRPPLPLEDSPKCPRCSLAGICLPDETNFTRTQNPPRPLNPADDPALPLYVQAPGARIRKIGEVLKIEAEEGAVEVPLMEISELALFGPATLTTPALHELLRREIPVAWHSSGGWFLGHTVAASQRGAFARVAQYEASFDAARSLAIARGLVTAKIRNQRTLLRRNWKDEAVLPARDAALAALKAIARRAEHATNVETLLGFEGEAAAVYFRHFERMIRADARDGLPLFRFETRNRRPPTDAVNALLSLGYSILTRTIHVALAGVGLDPYRGFYHRPRPGRPALALDLMEPYRPLIGDSTVLQVLNNGEIGPKDFVFSGPACALTPKGRKAFIAAYERRLSQETTHPVFGYRVSLRRLLEVQARLFVRHLQGEIRDYLHYEPR